MWRTKAVIGGAADDAQAAWNRGGTEGVAGAIGAAARGAITAGPTAVGELAYNTVAPVATAAKGFWNGLTGGGGAQTPATTLASAVPGAPPQAAPTAPSITPQTDVQRGGGNVPAVAPPSTNPAAPSPAATGAEIAPGVYQHGRGQYSDNASGMGMPAGFTGQPNAQNMAAADALAGRSQQESMNRVTARGMGSLAQSVSAPTVPNSSNDWAARNNLRNMEVSAKSITANGGRFDQSGRGDSPEVSAYKAALANDFALQQAQPGLAAVAMRENAGIQREGMQQEGATTRTGIQEQGSNARAAVSSALQRDEFGLKKEAAGFQTRAAARLENLQTSYEAEKDPAKRSELVQQMRELQVKDAPARYKVAAGGQQIDANGVAYRTPDRIFNEQTGVFSDGAGAAPAPQALPPKDQLKAGQTYSTPRGQARWDGNQFIPV